MPWMTPKTDWTDDDSINFNDFNRIENNILEAANYIASIQYKIPALTTITNRTDLSIDYLSSINRIEGNIEVIKNNFATPLGWELTKIWQVGMGFSYEDANRLENNTKLLMDLAPLAYSNFKYCGTMSCGDEGVIY